MDNDHEESSGIKHSQSAYIGKTEFAMANTKPQNMRHVILLEKYTTYISCRLYLMKYNKIHYHLTVSRISDPH
jgi:hypothetical protein